MIEDSFKNGAYLSAIVRKAFLDQAIDGFFFVSPSATKGALYDKLVAHEMNYSVRTWEPHRGGGTGQMPAAQPVILNPPQVRLASLRECIVLARRNT